ncbi:hypothetical protein U2I54_29225, partial [Bacillus pseudomycoides]|nr:hypothetical protein [Bacillus pseudomycoides]
RPDQLFTLKGDDPLTKYFNSIFEDGDWQNDWITHLPNSMREMIMNKGKQLERFEGLSQMDIGSLWQWRRGISDNKNAVQYRSLGSSQKQSQENIE